MISPSIGLDAEKGTIRVHEILAEMVVMQHWQQI